MAKKLATLLATVLLACNAFGQSRTEVLLNKETANFEAASYTNGKREVKISYLENFHHTSTNKVAVKFETETRNWILFDNTNDGIVDGVNFREMCIIDGKIKYIQILAEKGSKNYKAKADLLTHLVPIDRVDEAYKYLRSINEPQYFVDVALTTGITTNFTPRSVWNDSIHNFDVNYWDVKAKRSFKVCLPEPYYTTNTPNVYVEFLTGKGGRVLTGLDKEGDGILDEVHLKDPYVDTLLLRLTHDPVNNTFSGERGRLHFSISGEAHSATYADVLKRNSLFRTGKDGTKYKLIPSPSADYPNFKYWLPIPEKE
ncbi:MAG: hypothetical protein ACI8Y7_000716 [Candidatus Woesearchaeota archaeon]|jgi:hypothetical protein